MGATGCFGCRAGKQPQQDAGQPGGGGLALGAGLTYGVTGVFVDVMG